MEKFNHQHGEYDFHDHPITDDITDLISQPHDPRWVLPTTTRTVDPARQEPTEPFGVTRSELRVLLSGIYMLLDLYKTYKHTEVRRRHLIAEALAIRIQEVLK